MSSKKYKLVLGLLTLITTATFAQEGGSYSVFDSTVISAKQMPQQNEFWNNTYNFPAKPRNMWEIGASIGNIAISGDIPARIPSLGFEAHVRKAMGYVFSLRLQYVMGNAKGMNWNASTNYQKNEAWLSTANRGNLAGTGYNPIVRTATGTLTTLNGGAVQPIFQNYKSKVQDLSLQGIITLNNVRFHKQKTGIAFYGGAGLGFTLYNTKVNALSGTTTYATLFQNQFAASGVYENRKDVLKALKDGMDKTYETPAENEGTRRPKIGDNTLKPSGTAIAGIAFKLSNRINLALEDRHTFVKTDLMDGSQWQEHPSGDAVQTRDFDSWNYLSLGLNVNLGAKSVEPLWWVNPLDYAYSELNNPKHMKLPKPVFDDTDGDGVTDQLDREPNTPAGCPVDSHGVTKDTDGDGVPDCKDKQLITPTECQPVDADGVGKCPEPACCTEMKNLIAQGVGPKTDCPADYPSLSMKVTGLSKDVKAMLATVATKLKDNPTCTITITAYPGASKAQQSTADKKLDAVKNYLVETLGVSGDRITTDKKIDEGDANTIDIKSN
ncbi:MAG: hypothetical protein H7Z13_06685 [Ferruginibacter sp.]|nr:hypothetical protein [Ferruginibacter sp.]